MTTHTWSHNYFKKTALQENHVIGRGESCRAVRHTRLSCCALLLIASAIWFGFMGVGKANAEVIHGFADIAVEGFDFSEQVLVFGMDPASDLVIAFVVDPPLGYMLFSCNNSSLMIAVPDTSLAGLIEAPEDLSIYRCDGSVVVDRTYVIATSDGVYAKFAVRVFTPSEWIIEYYVQTDGSRNLVEPVGTEAISWGRVKSLYRSHR